MEERKNSIKDDEIDLLELALIVWRRKYFIIAFVGIIAVLTVIVLLKMDNVYESRAMLKPTQSNSSSLGNLGGLGALAGFAGINVGAGDSIYADIDILVKDKHFIAKLVKKNNFQEKLTEKPEFLLTDEFKQNEVFFLYRLVKDKISIAEDKTTKYITIAFRDNNPVLAKEFMSVFLIELSAVLKAKQTENIDKRIENYKNEIDHAADLTLKSELSGLVSNLIQSKVLANADEYYGFSVVLEPQISTPKDKVAPRRSLLLLISIIVSSSLSVFGVLIYDSLRKNVDIVKARV